MGHAWLQLKISYRKPWMTALVGMARPLPLVCGGCIGLMCDLHVPAIVQDFISEGNRVRGTLGPAVFFWVSAGESAFT